MSRPQRRHRITIDLQADDLLNLYAELEEISFRLRTESPTNSVSGGTGTGYIITYEFDESMTHEKYVKKLNEYVEAIKINGTNQP